VSRLEVRNPTFAFSNGLARPVTRKSLSFAVPRRGDALPILYVVADERDDRWISNVNIPEAERPPHSGLP
jgi:hypothetical protein